MTAEGTRWLDEAESAAWVALMGVIRRLESVLDAELRRDAGLNHFEYGVLAVLSESPERTLRMSSLANFADGSLPRLSQVVSRLQQRGWLHRRPDPQDGRYTLATLTDAGYDKVRDTAPGHVEQVRRVVFDPLTTPQVRQLTEIANRISRALATCEIERRTDSQRSPAPTQGRHER